MIAGSLHPRRRLRWLLFAWAALIGCDSDSGLTCRDGDFYLDGEEFDDCAQCDGKCDFTSTFSYPNGVMVRDSVTAMCDGETATLRGDVCEGDSDDGDDENQVKTDDEPSHEHTEDEQPSAGDGGTLLPSELDVSTWTFEGEPLPLANECRDMARRYCDQDEPCCAKLGMSFDRAHCEGNYLRGCAQGAIAVSRGFKAFKPDALEHCIQVTTPHYEKCELSPAEAEAAVLALDECSGVFTGGSEVGEPCSADWECAGNVAGGTWCDVVEETCILHPRLDEGEACVNSLGFCGLGLTCTDAGCEYLDERIEVFVACHP